MDLQQDQLDHLDGWLTQMEDTIDQQQTPGSDLQAIQRHITEHKVNTHNPYPAKLIHLNFQPLEVVSRYRDPQPQVVENYSY